MKTGNVIKAGVLLTGAYSMVKETGKGAVVKGIADEETHQSITSRLGKAMLAIGALSLIGGAAYYIYKELQLKAQVVEAGEARIL